MSYGLGRIQSIATKINTVHQRGMQNEQIALSLSAKGQTQIEARKQGSPLMQSTNVSPKDIEHREEGWRMDLERQTENIQQSLSILIVI